MCWPSCVQIGRRAGVPTQARPLQGTVFAMFYFLDHCRIFCAINVAEIFYHIRYAVDILEDACMDLRQ